MNSKPLHLVSLNGLQKDGNIAHYLNIILRWLGIGATGKGTQHG